MIEKLSKFIEIELKKILEAVAVEAIFGMCVVV